MGEMNSLKRAADAVGSVTELAQSIGVRQSTVSNWFMRGRVPAERCAAIELATKGAVTRAELRPDVFGELKPEDAA
ncbi:transcriptional regulator [Halorhodospira halophila]|uniref:transcriptional regulator n=1 Tax=Halorhodospira halophila TaxID=1053 RepID=UPI001F5CD373|nr:helix-turn-helix domain-containing protein [Halorhodospira halophila]